MSTPSRLCNNLVLLAAALQSQTPAAAVARGPSANFASLMLQRMTLLLAVMLQRPGGQGRMSPGCTPPWCTPSLAPAALPASTLASSPLMLQRLQRLSGDSPAGGVHRTWCLVHRSNSTSRASKRLAAPNNTHTSSSSHKAWQARSCSPHSSSPCSPGTLTCCHMECLHPCCASCTAPKPPTTLSRYKVSLVMQAVAVRMERGGC